MRHALLAVLLAAVSTPALADGFVSDGQPVTYTAERTAQGDVLLNGHAGSDPFTLRVHGNRVSGTMGVAPVAFRISSRAVAGLASEVPGAAQQAGAAPATLAAAN